MNATNRLNLLLNDPSSLNNRINQETAIQPITRLTFPERDSHPSATLPSMMATTAPLPPRRDSSSIKPHHHHRRRYPIDYTAKDSSQQQTYQPLLNSSTLDDLFRALTLECEQHLAATSSYQNKTYGKMIVQPSANTAAAVESNDEDYENLHPSKISRTPIITTSSPLKTSIQVISPIKRHVVSITVSSKITTPTKPPSLPTKLIPTITTTTTIPAIPSAPVTRHSSGEDSINNSSSSAHRKHRRRRTRRQFPSSTGTRSSSSSNERKKKKAEKKSSICKRSCSTDPRYQRLKTSHENHFVSPPSSSSTSQKLTARRPVRRDISLQHPRSNSERLRENYPSPLSVLLTSTKPTSDFVDNSHQQQQQRRSRLESVNQKSSTLLDRMHQQFYRPSPTPTNNNNNNNNNKNNILAHRMPSYPVY